MDSGRCFKVAGRNFSSLPHPPLAAKLPRTYRETGFPKTAGPVRDDMNPVAVYYKGAQDGWGGEWGGCVPYIAD